MPLKYNDIDVYVNAENNSDGKFARIQSHEYFESQHLGTEVNLVECKNLTNWAILGGADINVVGCVATFREGVFRWDFLPHFFIFFLDHKNKSNTIIHFPR